jgi:hypothetical protein
MQILEPGQRPPVDHPVVLVVGEWGLGKTSIGSSFDTTLIDFDEGAARAVNLRHVGLPRQWSDVKVHQLRGRKGVTIDTVEGCLACISRHVLQTAKYGAGGKLNQLGWAEVLRIFCAFVTELRAEQDVLFLAHAKIVREGDQTRVAARIPGSSYHEVMRLAHAVGYLHLDSRGRRVIEFNLTPRFHGKSALGVRVVPPVDEAAAFMQGLFDDLRGTLTAQGRAQQQAVDTLADWRYAIGQCAVPAEFERLLAALQADKARIPSGVYAQIQHLFRARLALMGVAYQQGRFVLTTPAAGWQGGRDRVTPPATVQGNLREVVGF